MYNKEGALKVGMDGKRAMFNFTGLGNYSRYAIGAMSSTFPGDEFMLYVHRQPREIPFQVNPNVEIALPDSVYGKKLGSLWRHYGGLASRLGRDGVDIYHGLSNELPLDIRSARVPSVVTIHDLIFRRIPANYKPVDRALYDFKFRSAARNATRVIAISERTKSDIMELYGVDESKIDVVYQGCNPLFRQEVRASLKSEVRKLYSLPERYVIMVGTVEQRKNQLLAVEAMRALPADVKLVIVGRGRNNYGEKVKAAISEKGLADRVVWLTGVPTEHLPALYSMATLAAYPSRYEGFGLPVIEALSCGVPVIAATGSCLEEAGGPGALYVNPDSVEEFAAEAGRLLGDDALRASMVVAGGEYISRFNEANFARKTMDSYMKAIREFIQ